jgi:hypothetical protein
MPHYHIHWSGKDALDWESFGSRAEAEASAKQLVRLGETYTIDERDEDCPRCRTAFKWKTAYETQETYLNPNHNYPIVKYRWQQPVLDAFAESDSECLIRKIAEAQRAISKRLSQLTLADSVEQFAIREALESLRVLGPHRSHPKNSENKKDVA